MLGFYLLKNIANVFFNFEVLPLFLKKICFLFCVYAYVYVYVRTHVCRGCPVAGVIDSCHSPNVDAGN